ncbi:MAG: heme ABC exporter ATP-binding protein CcmA [Gemmatimonadota bacterium]|nr:heme ABC exporter ATP-binding protein CcmA [Gemmatimonadota bacterium]
MTDGPSTLASVISTRALGRRFGARVAVRDVTLSLEHGDCLALFGPNGAGKTTLLRMLAGLLRPTEGSGSVAGVSLPGGADLRGAIGYISHASMLYAALSARENIELTARLFGVRDARAAAMRALERMELADRAEMPVRQLSRGMQQRVSIARATVHEPRVVLLDEPFTGLDDSGSAALGAHLARLRGTGTTMVIVTHQIAEGLALATHAAIMRAGELVRLEQGAAIDPQEYLTTYREHVTHGA